MDPNAPVTNVPRTPWPRAWTWAIVLAVGLFGAHATTRWWMPALAQALFGNIPTPADAPPLVWALLAGYLILSLAGGLTIASLCTEGSLVRDRHRWQHEEAERRRRWEAEARERQRLQEIRDQLYLDSLSPEERERILARRRREQDLDHRARAILEVERRGAADRR
jgi:hypothetical protein